jgi:1-acyl-sn-glycerol-3-phosphate acyltransferase
VLATFRVFRWDVRSSGVENLPTAGPAIVASNHVGYLDFAFLGAAAWERRRLVRFMALQEAFRHRAFGPLLRGMRHIPVDRGGDSAASFDLAARALRAGEVIGLHPEGKVSSSFVVMPGKSGAARLAIETGAPLIPAAVWGSQRILAPGRRPRFPRRVAVVTWFGDPIPVAEGPDPGELTATLMERIGALVDGIGAGYPQHPRGPSDRWWVPAHLGGTAPAAAGPDAGSGPR